MYCYQKPFIGLTLSINLETFFFKTLHDICIEYDYRSCEDFNLKDIEEYKKEIPHCEMDNPTCLYSLKLLNYFFEWARDNNDKLKYKTAYHGSLDTPVYIEFKDSHNIYFNDIESYCIHEDTLSEIHYEVQQFKNFCRDTMNIELFEYFEKNKMFGLHFVSCSS